MLRSLKSFYLPIKEIPIDTRVISVASLAFPFLLQIRSHIKKNTDPHFTNFIIAFEKCTLGNEPFLRDKRVLECMYSSIQ